MKKIYPILLAFGVLSCRQGEDTQTELGDTQTQTQNTSIVPFPDHPLHNSVRRLQQRIDQMAANAEPVPDLKSLVNGYQHPTHLADQYNALVKLWNDRVEGAKASYRNCLQNERNSQNCLIKEYNNLNTDIQKLGQLIKF